MTFEDRVDWLLENGFYLHRACTSCGFKKFHIMIGKDTRLYEGWGDTLSEAFTASINHYEKGETWPPAHLRKKHASSYKELDDTLKNLGIDLD